MDCSNLRTSSCMRRPQMPPMYGNSDFGYLPANACPMQPSCRNQVNNNISDMPIGMGYVPWQTWGQIYSLEQGLERGTIFPELDYPFQMGRCSR